MAITRLSTGMQDIFIYIFNIYISNALTKVVVYELIEETFRKPAFVRGQWNNISRDSRDSRDSRSPVILIAKTCEQISLIFVKFLLFENLLRILGEN